MIENTKRVFCFGRKISLEGSEKLQAHAETQAESQKKFSHLTITISETGINFNILNESHITIQQIKSDFRYISITTRIAVQMMNLHTSIHFIHSRNKYLPHLHWHSIGEEVSCEFVCDSCGFFLFI